MQRLARTYYLQDPDQETHQFMAGTPIGSLPDWFADAAPDALFDGDGEDEDQSLSVDEDSVGVAFHDADTDEMTKAEIMAELDRLGADYTKRDNHNKLAQALTLARAAVETTDAVETAEIQAVRDWVGSKPTDEVIESHFDDLGDTNRVALRILRQRLADWLRNPISFGTEEGYRENRKANIDQVKDQIARLEILIGDDDSTSLMTVGRVQRFDDEDRGWPAPTSLV